MWRWSGLMKNGKDSDRINAKVGDVRVQHSRYPADILIWFTREAHGAVTEFPCYINRRKLERKSVRDEYNINQKSALTLDNRVSVEGAVCVGSRSTRM